MSKPSPYIENLIKPILEASLSTDWEAAVYEWDIIDCEEDEYAETQCLCGHEGIRYCFRIKNRHTGNIIFPIGSECIKKFKNKNLSAEISVYEKLFKLHDAIRNKEFIEINANYFSRKLLLYFVEKKAIDEYEYKFLVDMFNKRDKDNLSDRQIKKINGLLGYKIKPYLTRTILKKSCRQTQGR